MPAALKKHKVKTSLKFYQTVFGLRGSSKVYGFGSVSQAFSTGKRFIAEKKVVTHFTRLFIKPS